MANTQNGKTKVFLCYAREDQTLMDDFYDRFHNYNSGDMEILYDRNANTGNMHQIFEDFASQCDVAILLTNARFVNPESYANKREVPVLIERQKKGEVITIGVRLSNVSDLDEWNAEGHVYFFQLTNNDLPNTRAKNLRNDAYLRKFAVYKQVDQDDRDDFHDRLRQWIKLCLSKRQIVVEAEPSSADLRTSANTQKIISKLPNHCQKLEENLSQNMAHWKGKYPQKDDWDKSFGWIRLEGYKETLIGLQEGLNTLSTTNGFFVEKLERQTPNLEGIFEDIRVMLELGDIPSKHPLNQRLNEAEGCIADISSKMVLRHDPSTKEELKTILFPQLKNFLHLLIQQINDLSKDFDKANT